jgi:hypothetical protein
MTQRVVIKDASPVEVSFDNFVPVGSQVTFALLLDEEVSPGVTQPINLTGKSFKAHLRRDLRSLEKDGEWTVTPRNPLSSGWVDFVLTGTTTASLGEGDFHFSAKMFDTGDEATSRHICVGVLPLRWVATR